MSPANRAACVGSDRVQLRAEVGGRRRWQLVGLRRNPQLAEQLVQQLTALEGVVEIHANPLSGRLLFVSDSSWTSQHQLLLILQCLDRQDLQSSSPLDLNAFPDQPPSLDHKTLFRIIQSAHGARLLRRRALFWSWTNSSFKITTPLIQGLIMAAALTGGFPAIARLGIPMAHQIGALALAYFGSASSEKYAEHRKKQAWTEYALAVEAELRAKAYRQVQRLEFAQLEQGDFSTSALTQLVKDDCGNIRTFLEQATPSLLDKGYTFVVCAGFLIVISPVTFLLALVPLPFMLRRTHRYNREIQAKLGATESSEHQLNILLSNSLNGIPTVRSFTAEALEQHRLEQANQAFQANYSQAANTSSSYHAGFDFGIYTGITLPIIYSSYQVFNKTLSFTAYTSTCFLLPLVAFATYGLDQNIRSYQSGKRSAQRLTRFFQLPVVLQQGKALQNQPLHAEIRLERLCFDYRQQHQPLHPASEQGLILDASEVGADPGQAKPAVPVLRELSLQIPFGHTVAFVGPSGSGKSTLIKLLLRFYKPTQGRILIGDQDIAQLNLFDLRRAIAWVGQDVYLFEGSIEENIRYGKPEADFQQLEKAAQVANATEFIQRNPNGWSAKVGQRGELLSGGQRQRISIARAILKDAPILILDEATSAMDNRTEACIQAAIKAMRGQRTLILVAHRLSTVTAANQIYLLEDGMIKEQGTHEELLQKAGAYERLWRLQINSEKEG